jgi:hypothetical protein
MFSFFENIYKLFLFLLVMAKRKGARRSAVPRPSKNSKSSKSLKGPVDYNQVLFLSSIIAFLAIVFLLVAFNSSNSFTGNAVTGYDVSPSSSTPTYTTVEAGDWYSLLGSSGFVNVFRYVFGVPVQLGSVITSIVVTIAVWLLLFFTFGDIIASFSSFSKWVSWVIAGLMTLIMANLGFVVKMTIFFVSVFAFVGTISVYVGLGTALVVFLLVNFGVASAGRWIMNRRILMRASQVEVQNKAGGTDIKGVIEGLGEIGEGLYKQSRKGKREGGQGRTP